MVQEMIQFLQIQVADLFWSDDATNYAKCN